MTEICVLTLQCNDRRGLVADVATSIAAIGGNIVDAQQYNDRSNGRFFMRVEFEFSAQEGLEALDELLRARLGDQQMECKLRLKSSRQKVLLLVSKFDHCLGDLLYRTRIGELEMDIVGIVCNHPMSALSIGNFEGIPFHHLAVSADTKGEQEARIKQIVDETGTELVVLARYMQILSDDLASFLSGRCINIHHSFLPGFKGAKPYHQAHERGVKMIGATAHYVTADLDEGPIIHQDVEAITHADTPDDLVRKGRDVERRVLAWAVAHHLDGRVFLNGARTIVFSA